MGRTMTGTTKGIKWTTGASYAKKKHCNAGTGQCTAQMELLHLV